jgi:RNA polymerase sigma-70 factor (ECF subfamily)
VTTVTAVANPVNAAVSHHSAMIGAVADVTQERMRELYRVHGRDLLRACLYWTRGDRYAAEDLMQETMVRAWRNLDRFDREPGLLRPWLLTVARRISIDVFRARSARPAEIGDNWWFEWEVEAPDPFRRLHDREVIRSAMHVLSEEQQAVILHVYVLDESMQQATRRLGIPEGTVKSRLHYALRVLRRSLEADMSAEERNPGFGGRARSAVLRNAARCRHATTPYSCSGEKALSSMPTKPDTLRFSTPCRPAYHASLAELGARATQLFSVRGSCTLIRLEMELRRHDLDQPQPLLRFTFGLRCVAR